MIARSPACQSSGLADTPIQGQGRSRPPGRANAPDRAAPLHGETDAAWPRPWRIYWVFCSRYRIYGLTFFDHCEHPLLARITILHKFEAAHVNRWRNFSVYMLAAVLCMLAIQNVIGYGGKFAIKRISAESDGRSIRSAAVATGVDGPEEWRQLTTRLQLYSLLNSLGNDKSLHASNRFGVVVLDPDFYRGRYIDKPLDTILKSCAIQPFSVPALTRMPLLSPFAPESENCRYEAYGYQYLPARHPMGSDDKTNPCELAKIRGFAHLVVISKDGDAFVEKRVDCAKQ